MTKLAKLTRPKLHQVLPRERLFARLDRGCERPLVWVSGPPGAGKTSLVASYVDARRAGGLWYQIDSGDNDPSTFFYYLSLAAADSGRKRQEPLPRLTAEYGGDLSGFARIFFRALFARFKAPALFVFDNYHELPVESGLHALLELIARELPEGMNLIVTSRQEPPPASAAVRALGRMDILGWDELRLSLDEARGIAISLHSLDEDALRTVHERTGGWPVGLTLMLEQMKRFGTDLSRASEENRDVLFEYFAAQTFAALPPQTRETLMLSALLPRITGAQAHRLTGQAEAAALLDSLYRRRLFVDKRGEAYQFHDLFRAFLLQNLDSSRPPADAQRARGLATRLLTEDGQIDDAFALARVAQDWEAAEALVLGFAAQMFEQGRAPTLMLWMATLPAERVERNPWLGLWLGVGLSTRAPAQARARFEQTYDRFVAAGDESACLLCCGGVLMTHYLEFDSLVTLDPWIDRLQALLARRVPFHAPAAELRVHSAWLSALSLRRPDPMALAGCIERVYALMREPAIPVHTRIDAAVHLLVHYCNSGDFEAAGRLVSLAQSWLPDPDLNPFYRALWRMQLGYFHLLLGEDAAAAEAYAAALAITEQHALPIPLLRIHTHIGQANLALNRGDIDAADAARARTASYWTSARRIDSAHDIGLRGLIAGRRKDHIGALALARQQRDEADAAGIVWLRFYSRLQLALALVDAGALPEVAEALAPARALVADTAYARLSYLVDLVEAYAALSERDFERARTNLRRGLGDSRGDAGKFFLRRFPSVFSALLADALAADIDRDYVRRLIRQFDLRPPDADLPDWPWPLEIRSFGRFEVLRDGKPLEYSRKQPRKTLALLKALIALGGGSVSEQRLIDTFWADEEGDVAARSLDATVLRLRTLLGDATAVIQQGGKLSLDRDRVWIDVFAFEGAVSAAEVAWRQRDTAARTHWQRALDLYQGAFLAEDEGEAWPVAARERLRGKFVHVLGQLAGELESAGEIGAAAQAYLRGIDADPVVESFYQGLMRCYQRLDRPTEAISAYRRLKQTLSITLGLAPSAATERLYQSLRERAGERQ